MATDAQIVLVVTMLEVLPRKEGRLTPTELKTYKAAWRDITDEALEMAAKDYLTTGTFFPVPGDIRKLAFSYFHENIPTALEAWDEIERAKNAPNKRKYFCDTATAIREKAAAATDEAGYATALNELYKHEKECKECRVEDLKFEFSNPIIEKLFLNMGGKKLRESEYAIADRSQFVKSYEVLVERALQEEVRLPEVKQLAERMSKQLPAGVK